MSAKELVKEIVETLQHLPTERISEVRDFAVSLKKQCQAQATLDESTEWSEEDIRDLTAAVMEYADRTVPWED